MLPTTQTNETVSMNIVVSKSAREKLARLKRIYDCDSLGCAVSTAIESIAVLDALKDMVKIEENLLNGSNGDPMSTYDEVSSTKDISNDELVESLNFNKEDMEKLAFVNDMLKDLHVDDIEELKVFIETGIVKIENINSPKISKAGEMPDDEMEWHE